MCDRATVTEEWAGRDEAVPLGGDRTAGISFFLGPSNAVQCYLTG